jgi:DNA invertase Pin-like site-specific DNA recombinase
MISNDLSMIRHNSIESARLSSAMDEFLRRGGQIQQAQAFGYVPKPVAYGSFAPPGKAVERAKPAPRIAPKPVAMPVARDFEKSQAVSEAKAVLVVKLRKMAETMTQLEAAAAVGIHRTQISRIGNAHGFVFRPAANNGRANLVMNKSDPVADAKNVERIKAMRDIGVSRRQAASRMGISTTLMRRLLSDYAIDYPLAVNRHK